MIDNKIIDDIRREANIQINLYRVVLRETCKIIYPNATHTSVEHAAIAMNKLNAK